MNISEECFKEIVEMVEALIEEADHHAHKKNPVVKITNKNYQVASGKSLPGPFNKNHVGQYIVYNKDTDASYLVTPDNWKKSKIKKDLESQGKFYEALEETMKLLELFDRPDLLDDIDTLLGSPVKKTFKKVISNIGAPKKEVKVKTKVTCKENLEEAMKLMEEIINEWEKTGYSNKVDKHLDNQLDNVSKKEGTKSPDENSLEYQNYMRDKVAADKASSEVWNQTRARAEQNKANYNPNSKLMRAEAIMRAQLRKEGNK